MGPALFLKIYLVPRSKHFVFVIKTSQLMLYSEIIAVCSQIHTKHINTLSGQTAEHFGMVRAFPPAHSFRCVLSSYFTNYNVIALCLKR
jgi:hypothetical protein